MAFDSLDAQREACEAYIASQKPEDWVAMDDRYRGLLLHRRSHEQLDSVAVALDDLAAARLVNAARDQLVRDIERRETKAA